MSLSLILLLLLIISITFFGYIFIGLNPVIVSLDILLIQVEIQLGYMILFTFLIGITFAIILEILYFSARRTNKIEKDKT